MGVLHQLVLLAWQSLLRGRAQTLLAVLGVAVGVGALVASIALGRGAQESLKDQLLAAGSNVIVITAGNYQVSKPQNNEGPAGHEGAALYRPFDPFRDVRYWSDIPGVRLPSREGFFRTHFEDDPNAVHDHPTAKDRLGDSMAGLGSAATPYPRGRRGHPQGNSGHPVCCRGRARQRTHHRRWPGCKELADALSRHRGTPARNPSWLDFPQGPLPESEGRRRRGAGHGPGQGRRRQVVRREQQPGG